MAAFSLEDSEGLRPFPSRSSARALALALILSLFACIVAFTSVGVGIHDRHALNAHIDQMQLDQNAQQASHLTHAVPLRLLPGDDLIAGLMAVVRSRGLKSAWVMTCVGSLTTYAIRFANQDTIATGTGHFEIVSLVGTLTSITNTSVGETNGAWHLHISVGDGNGKTISGHLATGSIIYTTAEVLLGYDCDVEFSRGVDGATPWDELQIRQQRWC